MVFFAGQGDRAKAVEHLRQLSWINELTQKHLKIDRPTQDFIDGVYSTLEDFALDDLYERLPEREGSWRRLRVFGKVSGDAYRIGRPKPGVQIKVGKGGARRAFGDFSAVARVKQVPDRDDSDDHNFLMRGQVGAGIGPIGAAQVGVAVQDALRILGGDADPSQPAQDVLRRIAKRHPKLDPHERPILAVAYESFPRVSRWMERLGQVEGLVVHRADGGPQFQHVKVALRIEPDRIEQHYEEFADYLEDLGALADVRLELVDSVGKRLLSARFSTETLRGEVEFFVREGLLVPSQLRGKNRTVYWKSPVSFEKAFSLRANATAHCKVLGIEVAIRRMKIDMKYVPGPTGLRLNASARTMPEVEVGGAALGFIPAALVDVFIPSNIEELSNSFLRTAVEGNHGRGAVVEVRHDRPSTEDNATIEVAAGVEALDNFLVTLGMGIAADRIIPDEDEASDIERGLWDAHLAFKSDLARFVRRAI